MCVRVCVCLCLFCALFDRKNFTTPVRQATNDSAPPSFLYFHDVRRSFPRLNELKAAVPDKISPCILKQCYLQLAVPFCYILNWSLETSVVPSCFKKSSIIPVPKKSSPQSFHDCRPVALTSAAMKWFEFLVKVNIQSFLSHTSSLIGKNDVLRMLLTSLFMRS